MLRAFYHPRLKSSLQQIKLQGLFTQVVKRAPSLFNSICGKVAKQVARFCVARFTV